MVALRQVVFGVVSGFSGFILTIVGLLDDVFKNLLSRGAQILERLHVYFGIGRTDSSYQKEFQEFVGFADRVLFSDGFQVGGGIETRRQVVIVLVSDIIEQQFVDVLEVLPFGYPVVGWGPFRDLVEEVLGVDVLQDFPQYDPVSQLIDGSQSLSQGKAVDPFQQDFADGELCHVD